jgi:hypothetical protein
MTATTHVTPRRVVEAGAAAALVSALLLLLAPAARPGPAGPLLNLGPVSVANGTATLSGSLTGTPAASYELHVNGQPLAVNADGTFSGTVDLAGQSLLTVSARNPLGGETVTTQIPLTTNVVGPDGLVPTTVLDALKRAGITLDVPENGFVSVDGLPIKVSGAVADRDQLSSLKVNGVDVLGTLRPDGSFAQSIPGSSREVTVTATDKQGVTQTTAFGVVPTSSVISTAAGPSIAAAGAQGLRIAKVRYVTKSARAHKRFRMIVTVKDVRGRLVRGATVRVQAKSKRLVLGKQRTKRSTRLGQAGFLVRIRPQALGRRVSMIALAQTPTAKAKKATSVRLPKARRPASRAHR